MNKTGRLRRVCLDDFERDAATIIDPVMFDYYRGGADEEITLRESRESYLRYRLKSRLMRDVSKRDTSTTILGHRVAFPCCIAPTACHKGAHPDGEIATAKASAASGLLMAVSSAANVQLEDIAKAAPSGLRMMQTYVYKNRKITELFLRRAEAAGYQALLVTVDFADYGKRRGEVKFDIFEEIKDEKKKEFYSQLVCVNMNMMEVEEEVEQARTSGDIFLWEYNMMADNSATWESITWIKSIARIPIVVKGVLSGEMAREAVAAGVDGILVSAHGGRQLDTAISPLDALPEVVDAVRDTHVEVYVDGGVRTGTDILKALALGARAVFIGRPALYGIACGGEDGLKELLNILKDEFSRAMALTGCKTVQEDDRVLLVQKCHVCTCHL